MANTPRFDYLIDSYKKMLKEDALTPNLTGQTPNPSATPVSQQNPNANKTIDPEKTKKLLDSYRQSALARRNQGSTGISPTNPNVPQTPIPGQGPTNTTPDATTGQSTPPDHDSIKKELYDHLVNDLGLTDEDIKEIYAK